MLEIFLTFLFTTSYIVKRDGNYDLFYAFALFILIKWVICGKKRMIDNVAKYYMPFIALGIAMIFYNNINMLKLAVYEAKLLLCIVCMIWVSQNVNRIKWYDLIHYICYVYGIETTIAFLWKTHHLWRLNDIINIFKPQRLKLIYTEPSELSFHCAILLIWYLYKIVFEKKENRKYALKMIDYLCVLILSIDMVLSAGMGGILASGFATGCMLVYTIYLRAAGQKKIRIKRRVVIVASFAIPIALLLFSRSTFLSDRIKSVLAGTDSSFNSRFSSPFGDLLIMFRNTQYLGCGFGNSSTEYGMSLTGRIYKFTNSFSTFFAEGGIFAILITVFFCFYLLEKSLKHKNVLALGFLSFIVIYQIPGGYFTNPMNYFVYGIVIGITLKTETRVVDTKSIEHPEFRLKMERYDHLIKENVK